MFVEGYVPLISGAKSVRKRHIIIQSRQYQLGKQQLHSDSLKINLDDESNSKEVECDDELDFVLGCSTELATATRIIYSSAKH